MDFCTGFKSAVIYYKKYRSWHERVPFPSAALKEENYFWTFFSIEIDVLWRKTNLKFWQLSIGRKVIKKNTFSKHKI